MVESYGLGLFDFPGQGVQSSIELTVAEYEDLSEACECVRAQYRASVFDLVVRDYFAFTRSVSDVRQRIMQAPTPSGVDLGGDVFRLDIAFLGLVTAFQIYLDHTRTRLTRQFGRESEEVAGFVEMLRSEFERSFAYRLVSKLRIYAIHCGIPPVDFQVSEELQADGEDEQLIREVTYRMTPRALLEVWDEWGGPLTQDLRERTEPIDPMAIAREAMHSLGRIADRARQLEASRVLDAADRVLTACTRARGRHARGVPHLFVFRLRSPTDLKGMTQTRLPEREAEDLIRLSRE